MFSVLYCAIFRVPSFRKSLRVLWDFHRLFGSRNSPTTDTYIRHVYRSVEPPREAKPWSGATLVHVHSAHDCGTRLLLVVRSITLMM